MRLHKQGLVHILSLAKENYCSTVSEPVCLIEVKVGKENDNRGEYNVSRQNTVSAHVFMFMHLADALIQSDLQMKIKAFMWSYSESQ